MALATLAALAIAGRQPNPPVAPFGLEMLPTEKVVVPMIFPVIGSVRWRDTYNQRRGVYRHTGQDLKAPKMTPIVAPFAGVLGFKEFSFWIVGDNGWRCLGTHLNNDTPGTNDNSGGWDTMFAANLRRGQRVVAGQLIGWIGDSGNATGPHLHFEIHGPNGIRNPLASLKNAQVIRKARLPLEDPDDVPAPGQQRWDICWRAIDRSSRMLKGMIVSRQRHGEDPVVELKPSPVWVKIQLAALAEGPGWDEIGAVSQDHAFRVYVIREAGGWEVVRFRLPKKAEASAPPADSGAPG